MKTVVSTGAAVIRDKRILLARRPDDDNTYPGHWGCPGGRQDPGETLKDTVVREVREEVGLDFTPSYEFGIYRDDVEVRRPGGPEVVHLEGHLFIGDASGDLQLDPEEVSECRWFTYEETQDLPLSFSYRKVLDDLHDKGLL